MLLAALRSREYYHRMAGALGPEYFQGDLFYVRQALDDYWRQNSSKDVASMQHLSLLIRKRCGEKKWESAKHVADALGAQPIQLPKAVEAVLNEYIEREGQKRWALEILEEADRGNPVQIDRTFRRLQTLSKSIGPTIRGHHFRAGAIDYKAHLSNVRVSTGMPKVDYALHGGLGAGDLGVLLAPWGGGKTTGLVHLGAAAATRGKRVLHISLEIPAWQVDCRYAQRLGGYTLDEVVAHPRKVQEVKKKLKGEIIIRDYSHQRVTPQFIESLIEDEKPDLLLLDYAALCGSTRNLEGRRFEIGDVFTDLRRVASACQIPIWTAHQATREASKAGDFTGNDVAEDISVSQTVDVLICMMKGRWNIDKTRLPRAGAERRIYVAADYDRQVFKEMNDGSGETGSNGVQANREGSKSTKEIVSTLTTRSRRTTGGQRHGH